MAEEMNDDTQNAITVFNMINRIRTISKRETPKKSVLKRNKSSSGAMASGKNPPAAPVLNFPSMAGFRTIQGIKYLNSYRLHSKNPFHTEKVEKILQDVMDERLNQLVYEPTVCTKLCVDLAADIRAKVKALQFERYKLICLVQICEKNNQSVVSQSKFLWDSERDKYAVYSFENSTLLAAALVYGIYYE
ncbi:tctex1 domain-containing protein 1 isoform X1 [Nilaparvata lugens]|uniref:tctex1 domain-containing protein 1 isoform X1 n=1 Tax=Nilaparvata lugens TaxID=108931 RepID=UPI00193E3AF4|nr:tctex1 domain-containing protein 1 isoform X1 [Nilaparvata lugens]